jgi:hypothetical protein
MPRGQFLRPGADRPSASQRARVGSAFIDYLKFLAMWWRERFGHQGMRGEGWHRYFGARRSHSDY